VDLGTQRRPAKRACADQALETVDNLNAARLPVAHHRSQLAVSRQRSLHLAQRLRRPQPQRRQPLSQVLELDRGDRRRDVVHRAHPPEIRARSRRGS
jgi:hypothetical protein